MTPRPALAGLSALAVTAGLAVATTVGAAPASAAVDQAPVAEGRAWLAGQLSDGLVVNPNFGGFTDYGLTVDAGLALAEVGDTATVDTISAALAPEVTSYYTYPVAPGKTHVSAGSLAKAATFAQVAGDDATTYGGQDLLGQLEDRVDTTPTAAGRIRDVFFPEEPFEADFSNVIGQSFAARALDTASSASAESVTRYLLAQQCTEGFFRSALGDTVAATCDADAAAEPSTDSTALAVLNLLGQDDVVVAAALDAAAAWLVSAQNADGSFGSDAQITTANANSTGLAGWALGELGETDAAEKAAIWLRAHQVTNTASCTPYAAADEGAIAYDDAAIAAVATTPVGDETSDQFRRATSQALPALRSAPDGVTSEVTSTDGYVRAGSTQRVRFSASPGDLVCVVGNGAQRTTRVPASGDAVVAVRLPAGTGTRTFRVQDSTEGLGSVTYRALGATELALGARDVFPRAAKRTVVVRGLAAREEVRIVLAGDVVARGRATAAGRFQRVVTVKRSTGLGKRVLRAVGEFDNRVGTTTVKVVRAR